MQTNLVITVLDPAQKKLQKTVTFVNSEASSTQLDSFARQFNAFTTNTYQGANRIDKTAIAAKTAPELSLETNRVKCNDIIARCTGEQEPYAFETTINYNGDGELFTENVNSEYRPGALLSAIFDDNGTKKLRVAWVALGDDDAQVIVRAKESDSFAAAYATLEIIGGV